ncbi:MAG TPA: glutathione binding-like protein, partial [Hyphomicrobium sp.]|nr:glutathione binding-like protein [Hyphomicrobium sp.]
AYIASELHKAFHPLFDPKASEEEKRKAGAAVEKKLDFIAAQFAAPYLFGPHPTVADNYLFVMLMWAAQMKLAIPEKLQAFSEHMRARPTVHVALKHEGLN